MKSVLAKTSYKINMTIVDITTLHQYCPLVSHFDYALLATQHIAAHYGQT